MKNIFVALIIALTCTLAACGSNIEWFPDPLDTTKPKISATIGGKSVFTNNSSNSSTTVTATVSSLPTTVVFTADEPATVYYTLNGADPTIASTAVDIPVAGGQVAGEEIIENNTTLKFFGIDKSNEKNKSAIQSILVKSGDATPAVITAQIGTVVIDSSATVVSKLPAQVTFRANEAATVYYKINSIEQTPINITTANSAFSGASITTSGTTLEFYSIDRSAITSTTQKTTITETTSSSKPAVIASINNQRLNNGDTVTFPNTDKDSLVFWATEPVTIYYTTNGSEPTSSSKPTIIIDNSLNAKGPALSGANTVLWFFGVNAANKESDKTKVTVTLK